MLLRLATVILLLAFGLPFAHAEVQLFASGALDKIVAERAGKPFILALWSITCTHCAEEMKTLGKLKAAYPKLDLVIVAADTPEDTPRVRAMAKTFGLARVPQWVFADEMPERLRYEIDKRWHGELPRTYFYDREHKVEAVSGLVAKARLEQWVKEFGQ